MEETEQVAPANVDPETGEVLDQEPETPEPQPEPEPDPDPADDDDETPAPEPEPQPDDDPSIEAQKRELDKMNTSLEREGTRHRNRVSEIIGESANELLPCPLCSDWVDGLIPPVQPPEEVVERVKHTLGLAVDMDYEEASFASQCPECKGKYFVKSGAVGERNYLIDCQRCNASGYVLNQPSIALAGMVPPPNGAPETVTPAGMNPDDPFMQEARERGLMVMPLPALPTYADASAGA